MKAVILAAGEGRRMLPLTLTTPKPLLRVSGKAILEHTFESLPDAVSEVVLVVGHKAQQIREFCGNMFKGKKISYVHQDTMTGTGGALWQAQQHLSEPFLVLNADDLYAKEDLEKLAKEDWAALVYQAQSPQKVAAVSLDEQGNIRSIVEGSAGASEKPLINTGVYALTPEIFGYTLVPKSPGSEEFGLPQTRLTRERALRAVHATKWFSMTDPSDIARAEGFLKK